MIEQLKSRNRTMSDSASFIPQEQTHSSSSSPNTYTVSHDFIDRSDHSYQLHAKDGTTEALRIPLETSVERRRTQQPDGAYPMSSPHRGMLGSPEVMLSDTRTSSDSANTLARQPVSAQRPGDLTQYMVESTVASTSRVSDATLTHDLFVGSSKADSELVDQRVGHLPAGSYDNRVLGESHMSMPLSVSRSLDTNTTASLPTSFPAQLAEAKEQNCILRKELELRKDISLPPRHGASRTLEQHLDEIRALRLRLEESIRSNDLLREQLREQLTHAGSRRKSQYGLVAPFTFKLRLGSYTLYLYMCFPSYIYL